MHKKITIVLLLVLMICLSGCSLFKKDETPTNNTPKEEEKNKDDETENTTPKLTNDKYDYYLYEEVIRPDESETDEDFEVFKEVFLYGDGTFYYGYAEYGDTCSPWYYGTYIISGGTLKLTSTHRGDCDECPSKENLQNFEFKYTNDKLTSNENEVLKKTTKVRDELPNLDMNRKCN